MSFIVLLRGDRIAKLAGNAGLAKGATRPRGRIAAVADGYGLGFVAIATLVADLFVVTVFGDGSNGATFDACAAAGVLEVQAIGSIVGDFALVWFQDEVRDHRDKLDGDAAVRDKAIVEAECAMTGCVSDMAL
jgi:hypothetical protein